MRPWSKAGPACNSTTFSSSCADCGSRGSRDERSTPEFEASDWHGGRDGYPVGDRDGDLVLAHLGADCRSGAVTLRERRGPPSSTTRSCSQRAARSWHITKLQ